MGRPPAAGGDDMAGQLADLAMLRESGALSQAEFERAKSRLLGN
jgi:Short C-terminal domain